MRSIVYVVNKFFVGRRMILEWICRNRMGKCGLEACGSEEGPVTGFCENGNVPSDSLKSGEILN
jgi:hypothetical protein